MKFQPILTGTATAILVICAVASSADAAISVIGNSSANSCYRSAEFGGDDPAGIRMCTYALQQEGLTARDKAATFINRGILRSRSGDANGALADYDKGLSIDTSLGEGYVDRGATYIALRQYNDALRDINRGLDMGARRPHIAYYDRAIVNEALGNIRGAYQDYKKAVELEPDFTLATQQLSRFKVIRKNPNGA